MADNQDLHQYWKETEIIRSYQHMLPTYGQLKLSYIFICESSEIEGISIIRRGFVQIQEPTILVPKYLIEEGMQYTGLVCESPNDGIIFNRGVKFPQNPCHDKVLYEEAVEQMSLENALDKYKTRLEKENDTEIGLIRGHSKGMGVSLSRYATMLVYRSLPGNIEEFMEHFIKQQAGPIKPSEKLKDSDIKKLFE